MAAIAHQLPFTMISRLIGFDTDDPDRLRQGAFDSTELLGSTLALERLEALVAGIEPIATWLADQLTTAATAETSTPAGRPRDDILGAIARSVADDVMALYEGTVILHTLLSAGGESTASLLGNAVRILAEHPALQDQLRHHPDRIGAFVEEALRLESPFRYLMRSTHQPTELGGVAIPAEATVLLFWGAANRDRDQYEHPDEIDLDRRILRHHVAFGRGIHHCVGAPLARVEAAAVLRVLLDQTTTITLDPDDPPRWANSLLFRRHARLPLKLTR
jgi:cytochrome P450